MSFLFGNRSNKTFKPKKNIPEGTHQYDLMKHAAATLGSGDLRLAVMLPEGEDRNEWVAVNIVDFFNQINMLYGTITEFCTEESCPLMSAGPKYEYHWADGTTVKKPIKCSAPKYIDYLMTWVQDQLDDENIFPSKIGVPFPKNFSTIARTILKRLFRVYAHIYHQHFPQVVQLDEEAHLNTSFKHFIFFVQEFDLIDKRELAPLSELIEKLIEKRDSNHSNTNTNNINQISSNSSNSGPSHHFHHNMHHQHKPETAINYQYPSKQSNKTQECNYYPRILNQTSVKPSIPNHPPPHYPTENNGQKSIATTSTGHHHGLPLSPPKQSQASQYYNLANTNQQLSIPAPPPAYHQHLQQLQSYRNLNSGSSAGGGFP